MEKVVTRPDVFYWKKIVDNENLTSSNDVSGTISIKQIQGTFTLWIQPTTITTAGDVSIALELYNEESGTWGEYSGGSTLTSVSSSSLSTSSGIYIPINSGMFDAWTWADKARITLSTSSADVVLDVYLGGQ